MKNMTDTATLLVAHDLLILGRVIEATALAAEAFAPSVRADHDVAAVSLARALDFVAGAYDVKTGTRIPVVGDVLESSWGYDQTNVDFYQVIAVTAKSVRIREIGKRHVSSTRTQDMLVPMIDAFAAEKASTRRVQLSAYDAHRYGCKITDYSSAYLWDGAPARQTGAACGH